MSDSENELSVEPVEKRKYDVKYKRFKDIRLHMLERPDMYGGSRSLLKMLLPVLTEDGMVMKKIECSWLSMKLFFEILDNAMDAYIKAKTGKTKFPDFVPEVVLTETKISVLSGGAYIVIKEEDDSDENSNEEKKIWSPTLLFGRLLSGSNFDEQKTVKGKNGVGAKLVPVFSKKAKIECTDPEAHISFKQIWRDNREIEEEPIIDTKWKGKVGTVKVTYTPDIQSGVEKYSADVLAHFSWLVATYSFLTNSPIKLNGEELEYSGLEYIKMWPKLEGKKYIHHQEDNYNIYFFDTPGKNMTISFVNGGYTPDGGEHVNAYSKPIYNQLLEIIKKKFKDILKKKPTKKLLEPHVSMIICATVIDPEYESQSKLKCTGPKIKGVKLPDFTKQLSEWTLFEKVEQTLMNKLKEGTNKADTKKTGNIRIDNVEGAEWAGTKRRSEARMIFVEGESGMTVVRKGRNRIVDGNKKYGITFVKGKVNNLSNKKEEAKEKAAIVQRICFILGIKPGDDCRDPKVFEKLRYGGFVIMTDADPDGKHICYLIIRILKDAFPGLLEAGFVSAMLFPTVTATKGKGNKNKLVWYSLSSFEAWKEENNDGKGWNISYFKGLGSCSDADINFAFNNPVTVRYVHDPETDEALDLAFLKNRANDRKVWMLNHDPKDEIEYEADQEILISDGVNKELILFSLYSVDRGIPNVLDGLLTGQRKIIFATKEANVKELLKVAQLAGKVAELSDYRHGEKSLEDSIKKMCQKYPKSNNVAYLGSYGQLGSRYGGDAASSRYTFAKKGVFFDQIITDEDNNCIQYQYEGKQKIEPKNYYPPVCMTLINGVRCGIGTGWMCKCPPYQPRQIIEKHEEFISTVREKREKGEKSLEKYLKKIEDRLQKTKDTTNIEIEGEEDPEDVEEDNDDNDEKKRGRKPGLKKKKLQSVYVKEGMLIPWARYYNGNITVEKGKIIDRGVFEHKAGTITISEVPLDYSFSAFKEKLEKLQKPGKNGKPAKIKRFDEPVFVLHETGQDSMTVKIHEFDKEPTYKNLGLERTIGLTCLNFFDEDGKVRHFESPEEILDYYHICTLRFKGKVLEKIVETTRAAYEFAEMKARFLQDVLEDPTLIANRDDDKVEEWMNDNEYDLELLKIPIKSITKQSIAKTLKIKEETKEKYDKYNSMYAEDLWEEQINAFKEVYDKIYSIDGEIEPKPK